MSRLEHIVLVNETGSGVDDLTTVASNLVSVPSRKVRYLIRLLRHHVLISVDGYKHVVGSRLLVFHTRRPLVLL